MVTGMGAVNFLDAVKHCLMAAGGTDLDVVKFIRAINEYDLDIVQLRATNRASSPEEFGFLSAESSSLDPPFSEG